MIRLHPEQLNGKLRFMDDYIAATNAADGSKMDANANVTHKNIATMENELMKDFLVQVNRAQVSRKISELFGAEWAQEYIRQIEAHEIYVHDETSLKPYCVSVTLYPFLRDGLAKLVENRKRPNIWLLFAARLSIWCLPSAPNLPARWPRWNFSLISIISPAAIMATII
jgi:hypothetical protein